MIAKTVWKKKFQKLKQKQHNATGSDLKSEVDIEEPDICVQSQIKNSTRKDSIATTESGKHVFFKNMVKNYNHAETCSTLEFII